MNSEQLVAFLYNAIFVPDWKLSGNPKCVPQKVGERLLVTDARILVDIPFHPVTLWREQVGEDFNWHEGDKPVCRDGKHWLDLAATLEKFFLDTTSYPIPLATKPEHTPDTWLTIIDCDHCNGVGSLYGYPCVECDGNCKFEDLHPSAGEPVSIEGNDYSRRFIWMLSQLPNARFVHLDRSTTGDPQSASFVFDGGRGVLMPFRRSVNR